MTVSGKEVLSFFFYSFFLVCFVVCMCFFVIVVLVGLLAFSISMSVLLVLF